MKIAMIRNGATGKMIAEALNIPRWGRGVDADVIVNYGVFGSKFRAWEARNPIGRTKLILNRPPFMNKFEAIEKVSERGVNTPLTLRSLSRLYDPSAFLVKPFFSQQGRGIKRAESRHAPSGKYFQEFIEDRLYELRVHSFKWIPSSEWVVQKRVNGEGNEESVTWNHHTGGRFITVNDTSHRVFAEAKEMSKEVLSCLNMAFGGVDFIVSASRDVYFIEVNSAVGCCGLSDPIYIDAFQRLKYIDRDEVMGYVAT